MKAGGQRHAPSLYPQERPGNRCIGDRVGLTVGLDRYGKSSRHRDSILGPSSPQRVAILTELPRPHISYTSLKKSGSLFSTLNTVTFHL
jgi:hypothetical protein